MAEYIEREAVVDRFDEICNRNCPYSKKQRAVMCGACLLGDAYVALEDDRLLADVKPVVRGEWEWDFFNIVCSECNFAPPFDSTEPLYNYCPNCGADMRRENDGK